MIAPAIQEYVARGAARQAAWVLAEDAELQSWNLPTSMTYEAEPETHVRDRFREASEKFLETSRTKESG